MIKENITTQELAKHSFCLQVPGTSFNKLHTTQETQSSMEPLVSPICGVHTACTLRKENMETSLRA